MQEEGPQESDHLSIEDNMKDLSQGGDHLSLEGDFNAYNTVLKPATMEEDIDYIFKSHPRKFFSRPRNYKSNKIVNSLTSPTSVLS